MTSDINYCSETECPFWRFPNACAYDGPELCILLAAAMKKQVINE